MAIEVLMPKLGLTMTEGTIEEWKFHEGDAVKKGEILFSVATDKLTNDVEAEADGTLLKILLPEGETAACGAVVAYLGAAGESTPAGTAAASAPVAPAPEEEKPAAPVPAPAAAPAAACDAPTSTGRIRISPYARKTAQERGIDISTLTGTGPNGRIVWRDVNAAPEAKEAACAAPAAAVMVAGLYTSADVTELLTAVKALNGALSVEQFVTKAAAKLNGDVCVRYLGGVEGFLPGLDAGQTAVLGFGDPTGHVLRLNLAYVPAALDDAAAADFLRDLASILETPLSLLA
ncbi:MAG: E3 binding domain-containing protein [Oscillibacter sp.]|jgi:pyruvate/2-oxoglutarate dehydrogenase complex dihydrolipoamide acyltransferase (E2) component|nr:E3 binding domain-containing protein [Oscillibacter sp.]